MLMLCSRARAADRFLCCGTGCAKQAGRMPERMRLALFDLDHTLLPIDSGRRMVALPRARQWSGPRPRTSRRSAASRTTIAAAASIPEEYLAFQMGVAGPNFPRGDAGNTSDPASCRTSSSQICDPEAFRADRFAPRARGSELALVTGTNAFCHRARSAERFGLPHLLAVRPRADRRPFSPAATSGTITLRTRQRWWPSRPCCASSAARSRRLDECTFYTDSINRSASAGADRGQRRPSRS